MESDRQAFNTDINLSKRTAITRSRCTSGVRSLAPPLQIRPSSIESALPALSLRAKLGAEAES